MKLITSMVVLITSLFVFAGTASALDRLMSEDFSGTPGDDLNTKGWTGSGGEIVRDDTTTIDEGNSGSVSGSYARRVMPFAEPLDSLGRGEEMIAKWSFQFPSDATGWVRFGLNLTGEQWGYGVVMNLDEGNFGTIGGNHDFPQGPFAATLSPDTLYDVRTVLTATSISHQYKKRSSETWIVGLSGTGTFSSVDGSHVDGSMYGGRIDTLSVTRGSIDTTSKTYDPSHEELRDPIEILNDQGEKLGQLPAERSFIPFDEGPRCDARLGVTRAGHIYVAMWNQLRWSTDGGRTWQGRSLPLLAGGFGILRDDTFVVFGGFLQNWTIRSTDYGQTWSDKITLDRSPFTTGGGGWTQICHPPHGPALMTVTLRYGDGAKDHDGKPLPPEKLGVFDYVFRSTDSGKTWGDKSLIVRDSAESSVIVLHSGKMLAGIRKQRHPVRLLPGDDIEQLKAMGGWRNGKPYIKHGFLADSTDGGYTWINERLGPNTPDMKDGLCPSDFVQLPDGRVVWIYTHRYGPDTGVMARTSTDDGATWSPQRYRVRLAKVPGNSTYPTNAVLEDGTILTVCGKNHGNRAMAIRWRLPK